MLSCGLGSSSTPCRFPPRQPRSHSGVGTVPMSRRPAAHERDGPGDASPPRAASELTKPMIRCHPRTVMTRHRPDRHHPRILDKPTGEMTGQPDLELGMVLKGAVPHTSHIRTGGLATRAWYGGRSPQGHEPAWAAYPKTRWHLNPQWRHRNHPRADFNSTSRRSTESTSTRSTRIPDRCIGTDMTSGIEASLTGEYGNSPIPGRPRPHSKDSHPSHVSTQPRKVRSAGRGWLMPPRSSDHLLLRQCMHYSSPSASAISTSGSIATITASASRAISPSRYSSVGRLSSSMV